MPSLWESDMAEPKQKKSMPGGLCAAMKKRISGPAVFALALTAAASVLAGAWTLPAWAAVDTSYSALTSAYRLREPFLQNSTDENGRSRTEVIDRGDCYELTNVLLFAYVKYNEDDVDWAGVGDTLKIDGKGYIVKEISDDGVYTLTRTDGYGNISYEYLRPVNAGKNKKGYYIAVRSDNPDDESFDSADLYYTGSVFIRKDCPVLSAALAEDGSLPVITAETYLTGDSASFSPNGEFRYGRNATEQEVTLKGKFTLDAGGYIVNLTEKY